MCPITAQVVSEWFDLAIYTAALQPYANAVVEHLDAGRGLFPIGRRFFRDDCSFVFNGSGGSGGGYRKDVRLVMPDLCSVAIIDNSPSAYKDYAANGIPIKSWTSDPQDTELLQLLPFLDALRFVADVRSILGAKNWHEKSTSPKFYVPNGDC